MKNTALITGSSKGIGRELSLLLLQKGYTVFGYSRTNSIKHKNFHFNQIDLTQVNNLESIRFPQVKKDEHICLINNAGDIGEIEKFGNKKTNDIINEFNYLSILNKNFKVQELIEVIYNVDKDLIKSVKVFDVYEGKNIPDNKKSIALNVTIQSSEKTLNEDDLNKINQTIISTVESKIDAKIRS